VNDESFMLIMGAVSAVDLFLSTTRQATGSGLCGWKQSGLFAWE